MAWELKTRFGNGGEEWLTDNDEIVIVPGHSRISGKDTTGKWEVVTDNPKLKDRIFRNKVTAYKYAHKLMNKYSHGWGR